MCCIQCREFYQTSATIFAELSLISHQNFHIEETKKQGQNIVSSVNIKRSLGNDHVQWSPRFFSFDNLKQISAVASQWIHYCLSSSFL
ncbi:hypothetical protein EUGRSUZ_J01300 [Eucalyptus grandis]|uniref:Uncharacterized protein n=3 Tax=Eucalyptus grandis TaxID=71139 RepID=A0A059ADE7_EUCGR|nr:hypothetical protein EUGRSUZ_J01300 [Eucalyptus grandis]KAK3419274.1 hypothetical protein EUGRSUZ_J01300 [Eucalyptus grandis]